MKAQIGQPYAPVGAKWTYLGVSYIPTGAPTQTETYEVVSVADTFIQNRRCSKLQFNLLPPFTQFAFSSFTGIDSVFFYHVDNRRVFRYETSLDSFFLLYDFNVSTGDSFDIFLPNQINFNILTRFRAYVVDTNQVLVNGSFSKVIKYDLALIAPIPPNIGVVPEYVSRFEVAEKLGDFEGAGYHKGKILTTMGFAWHAETIELRCFEDSIGIYKRPGVVNCDTSFISSVATNYFGKPIEIYPNPAKNSVRVNLGKDFTKTQLLSIRDISGKLVKTFSISESSQTLDLSGIAKGMYFVLVHGHKVEKLIINH